ncbi:MAG: enoyl-CoA hydratase/isomerase family protein [Pseudomonadota bacterium]|nr:enoyl-CoA hydratase/isomerase family protein [Pseudomonadota bacterium]
MELEQIELVRDGAVAVITLNRPQSGNALSSQMALELKRVADTLDHDSEVRAVVLTGAGKHFCFGGDLKEFVQFDADPAKITKTADDFHAAQLTLLGLAKPLIVAVNGVAAGGGLSMALIGDIVLVDEKAKFRVAYTAAGLSPDGGSTWLLPRVVGLRRAQDLIFTNQDFSADEAIEWGVGTRVVAAGTVLDEAIALAKRLAMGPTMAYASSRKLLLSTFTNDFATQTDAETAEIAANMSGRDGQEGMDAFINKRRPAFTGTQ